MAFESEKHSFRELIRIAKENGAVTFRLFDTEDWACDQTADVETLVMAANSTGQDALNCFDANGDRLGYFVLVWGNARNGEELVSDYGINDFTEAVWEAWFKLSEEGA